jgi:hypothetical protein
MEGNPYHFLKTQTEETNPKKESPIVSFEELSHLLENAENFSQAESIYEQSITCEQKGALSEEDRDELQVWALGKMTEFATTEEELSKIKQYYQNNQ